MSIRKTFTNFDEAGSSDFKQLQAGHVAAESFIGLVVSVKSYPLGEYPRMKYEEIREATPDEIVEYYA